MISGEWTGTRHDEGSGLEIQQIMMNWMSCWLSWMGRRGLILILGVSYVMCCLVSIVNLLFIMFILTCFTSNWIVCTTLHKINWHGIARSGSHSQRKTRFSKCWWLRVLPSLLTDVQTIPSPMPNHLKVGEAILALFQMLSSAISSTTEEMRCPHPNLKIQWTRPFIITAIVYVQRSCIEKSQWWGLNVNSSLCYMQGFVADMEIRNMETSYCMPWTKLSCRIRKH
jgi:hypothetical protein